jgi:pantothenate kinase
MLLPEHKVVVIEGLYLLLKSDPRWEPLQSLWDERWFVKAPSLEIQRQRLIQRVAENVVPIESRDLGGGRNRGNGKS